MVRRGSRVQVPMTAPYFGRVLRRIEDCPGSILNQSTMENVPLRDLMDRYLQHGKLIRGYAPATLKTYESTFSLFLKETDVENPQQLERKVFEAWFYNGRLKREWSACTFRDHLKHLNPS